jgi:hypothetical protein
MGSGARARHRVCHRHRGRLTWLQSGGSLLPVLMVLDRSPDDVGCRLRGILLDESQPFIQQKVVAAKVGSAADVLSLEGDDEGLGSDEKEE